jgi:hypothetical protein
MTDPRPEVACPLLLLLSALIFSAFYWLEVRHFMNAQKNFNEAISDAGRALDDAVPLPLATFLLGVLLMMTLATGILKFADEGLFRAFVLANLLFWLCDLGGTIILKRSYVRFEKEIRKVMEEHRADHAWFVGHIVSRFFYLYSGGNAPLDRRVHRVSRRNGWRACRRDVATTSPVAISRILLVASGCPETQMR